MIDNGIPVDFFAAVTQAANAVRTGNAETERAALASCHAQIARVAPYNYPLRAMMQLHLENELNEVARQKAPPAKGAMVDATAGTPQTQPGETNLTTEELVEGNVRKRIPRNNVTDNESIVLAELLNLAPRLVKGTDIIADLDPKTVRGSLKSLEAKELIHRPDGKRSGYGLTPAGKVIAEQLKAGN